MMENKIIIMLTLTILAMFFIAGCAKTEIEPTPEEQPISGETGDETINSISDDISDIDVMNDNLDTGDLDNLSQDLNDLDW